MVPVLLAKHRARLFAWAFLSSFLLLFGSAPLHAAPGDFDPTFNPSADTQPYVIAEQPDGSFVVVGSFQTIDSTPRGRVARFSAAGVLDPSFNPNADGVVAAVAIQPDGKILIAGQFAQVGGQPHPRIARLNADGSLDNAFSASTDGTISSLAIQIDGSILIAGTFTTVNATPRARIARLLPSGLLDTNFTPVVDNEVNTIFVQPDGKILISGLFDFVSAQPRSRFARLESTGALDTSFVCNANDVIHSIAVQPDGKILVCGKFSSIAGVSRLGVVRLNSNGTHDASFTANLSDFAFSIALQADGSVIAAGQFLSANSVARRFIARLGPTGTLDPVFQQTFDSLLSSATLERDGRVLVNGNFINVGAAATPARFLARLVNDTAPRPLTVPDNTRIQWLRGGTAPEVSNVTFEYSADGSNWTPVGTAVRIPGGWEASGLTLASAGNIRARARVSSGQFNASNGLIEQAITFPPPTVSTGAATFIGTDTATLEAIANPMGNETTISFRYGTDPSLVPSLTSASDTAGSGVSDFSINIGITGLSPGTTYYYQAVARNANTTVNGAILSFTTFGPLPDPDFDPQPTAEVYASPSQADGKIILVGGFERLGGGGGPLRSAIARLLPDGTLDATFDPGANSSVLAVAIEPAGTVLVGGTFATLGGATHNRVGRISAAGVVDPTFVPDLNGDVFALALMPDGRFLVAGGFTTVNGVAQAHLARLNADGSLDATFAPVIDAALYTVAVQPNDSVVIGGFFNQVNATARTYVARLNATGALDATFDPVLDISASNYVRCIAIQPDGSMLIGGNFATIDSTPRARIARLLPNGELDPTFDVSADDEVASIALLANGNAVVGGTFNSISGVARGHVARLNSVGAVDPAFNPGAANGVVYSLTAQQDGDILIGGSFDTVGGLPRSYLARIDGGAASQQVTVPNASTVRWLRSGAVPEVEGVVFDFSTDFANFSPLAGTVSRIAGGWEITGTNVPASGIARTRGISTGGYHNGSSSIMSSQLAVGGSPPVVTTSSVNGVTARRAFLHGIVNPNGQSTMGHFEYSTDPGFAGSINTPDANLGSGSTDQPLDQQLTLLADNTQYFFRAVATNASGTVQGQPLSFTTGTGIPIVQTSPNPTVFIIPATGLIGVNIGATFTPDIDFPAIAKIQVSLDPAFTSIAYEKDLGAVSGTFAIGIGSPDTYVFDPATTYYYRGFGISSRGAAFGAALSFITPGVPPPVVGTDDPVPNEPPGTTFVEFGSPAVDQGIVGGSATITRPSGKSATIIFGGLDGSVLARTDGQAPTGETFVTLGDPVFGGAAFGFAATSLPSSAPTKEFTNGPFTSRLARPLSGLWSSRSSVSGLQQIAVQGGGAPGVTGGKFAKLSGFGLPRNRAGLLFLGKLGVGTTVPKESASGIWRERPTGGVDLLLRSGSPLEITGGGIRQLRKILFMTSVANAPDQRRGFAPDGGLSAGVTFADGSSGIARIAEDGTTDIPVETTSPVPTLDGAQWAGFATPATASAGRFAFRGTLKRGVGGVTPKDDQAIFASLGGPLQPIIRRGATLPGGGTATLNRLGEPLLGEGGVVGLIAALSGNGVSAKNRDAIVLHRGGNSTIVARLGEPAPEAGDGVVFQRFVSVVVTDAPQARLLFTASVAGSGINKRNRTGIWAVTPDGSVRLVLRLGKQITVGSETPTVTLIDALNAKPANRGQGRSTDASGFLSARVKLSNRRSGLLRIPLP